MARAAQPSASLVLLSLGLVLLCFTSVSTVRLADAQAQPAQSPASPAAAAARPPKTWCVARPSADEKALQGNINYVCQNVSCSVIQPGGPCFNPNTLASHASIAMNLYYAYNGRHSWNCYFRDSGIIVQSDPSYGSCTFY
ncbi:major pollen allergen Ole e 10 [Lolium perenne]|uniref:major pollen allergen Ole e 10 n=1 Tax=Lolium perenne TaxID=4522 RepID=UPI0021F54504|nr:glucan endo-1,3-beta-D-glucosidase-like [Lolium perenne]